MSNLLSLMEVSVRLLFFDCYCITSLKTTPRSSIARRLRSKSNASALRANQDIHVVHGVFGYFHSWINCDGHRSRLAELCVGRHCAQTTALPRRLEPNRHEGFYVQGRALSLSPQRGRSRNPRRRRDPKNTAFVKVHTACGS